jgi:hypothetical protein
MIINSCVAPCQTPVDLLRFDRTATLDVTASRGIDAGRATLLNPLIFMIFAQKCWSTREAGPNPAAPRSSRSSQIAATRRLRRNNR